jgi:uncharacterized protein DUF2877
MRAVLAGAGVREALAVGGSGRVLARFRRAWYLELPGGLVAVVSGSAHPGLVHPGPGSGHPGSVHPGPLHLVVDGFLPEARVGAPVRVLGATLLVGDEAVDLSAAEPWLGRLPEPTAVVAAGPLLARATGRFVDGSALLDGRYRRRVGRFLDALRAGDLAAGAAELGGLGPGLTPAGDDALAAVLLHRRCVDPAAEAVLRSVASSVRTGAIAAAYLGWAARGQVLAPAHDLLGAAAGGDEGKALAAAMELSRVGESSGADFCLGLLWAATTGQGPGQTGRPSAPGPGQEASRW